MNCPKCYSEINKDDKYCANCGENLQKAIKVNNVNPNVKRVKKRRKIIIVISIVTVTAIILGIFSFKINNKVYKIPNSISFYDEKGNIIGKNQCEWDFTNNKYILGIEDYEASSRNDASSNESRTMNLEYTPTGMISKINCYYDKFGTYSFTYNRDNKLTEYTELSINAKYYNTEKVTYSNNYKEMKINGTDYIFDDKNNLIAVNYNNENNVEYTYDNYNNMIKSLDSRSQKIEKKNIQYDNNNNIISYNINSSDYKVKLKYDKDNYPTEITINVDNNISIYKFEYTTLTEQQYNAILELRFTDFGKNYLSYGYVVGLDGFGFYDFLKPVNR